MNPYLMMGGEPGVRRLADLFYDAMDSLPEAAGIRAMHHGDLAPMRQKLFEFLSGWLGGPQLYIEKYGHPRLRARHLPFPIGASERDQWMLCMDRALEQLIEEEEFRLRIRAALAGVADHMRNREG